MSLEVVAIATYKSAREVFYFPTPRTVGAEGIVFGTGKKRNTVQGESVIRASLILCYQQEKDDWAYNKALEIFKELDTLKQEHWSIQWGII